MKYPQPVSMPSAVSNWLEEQLEARGIDAVVYTRYVLSLLHSHPVDVIYPDDLQLSHLKKELERGRKRSRKSSSDWWRYAHADADQIKRSAAVECLVSASDQNCEIESLVDELCEKLKEVNSEPASPISAPTKSTESEELRKITPQELAEKYYAAFPPLCPQSPTESKLLSLTPKWKPAISPIKKKTVRKQGIRPAGYENKLRLKEVSEMKARTQNKQRLSYFSRNKNAMPRKNNSLNWDFCMFNRRFGAPKLWNSPGMEQESLDQCIDVNRDIWTSDPDVNMYEDLPVDIEDLLDSPCPHDDNVEMNMANMRDVGKREYIPYGTNIISSIWSNDQDITYDNTFNSAVDRLNDIGLDYKFSSISIDAQPAKPIEDWPTRKRMAENETNRLFEKNCCRSLFNLHDDWKTPDEKEFFNNDKCTEEEEKLYAFSLLKLNHNKEESCFSEVAPGSSQQSRSFNPFSRNSSMFSFNSRHCLKSDKDKDKDKDKEDLLTSEYSHFKPISEKPEVRQQTHYADGATFVISNNLDKVEYKRSDSGTMWLETDQGQNKKYFEYKVDESCSSPDEEFILKFSICQNDKACQTEEPSELDFETVEEKNEVEETAETTCDSEPEELCTCPDDKIPATPMDNSSVCPLHPPRPESMLGEILWKYETKACEKCNNNVTSKSEWPNKGQMDYDWDNQGLRDIWSGGEMCQKCLTSNGGGVARPGPSLELREDISQDGEQLLSDLSTIQKTYMEELPEEELSCDIDKIVSTATAPPNERKRRHSFVLEPHPTAWSFASRLEEDCLIQMSTLPTLRSVTL